MRGRDFLSVEAVPWAPAVGPQMRSLHLDVLRGPRKNHPGPLLNKFPGPTADPSNQHVQGAGEPRGECALEVLLRSFGKCRPHSAFTDVEPRPRAGVWRGHPEIRSCLLCMIFLQPGLSHRHEVDIVQSTLLKCGVCTILKRLPANKSRVHCSFGCVLLKAPDLGSWEMYSAEPSPARPAWAEALLQLYWLQHIRLTCPAWAQHGCLLQTWSEGIALLSSFLQPGEAPQALKCFDPVGPAALINLPGG